MITAFFGTVFSVLMVVTAGAQGAEPQCDNPTTQVDMNLCAGHDFKRADALLNTTYQQVLKQMRATDQALAAVDKNLGGAADLLTKAQRGWIEYREAHCELAGFQARGGSMPSMLVSSCLADLTRSRTQELKVLLNSLH